MATKDDLTMAVLSMAAYKPIGDIGSAVQNIARTDDTTGFAAVAYIYKSQFVISYRGTDDTTFGPAGTDTWYGYGTGLGGASTQASEAAQFYHDIVDAGFPYATSTVFTGHSLGGGLAGLMGSLYGKQAVIFDNMAYAHAADVTYTWATAEEPIIEPSTGAVIGYSTTPAHPEFLNTYYGNATPTTPDSSHITGFQENGQLLQLIGQSTGTVVGADVAWGINNPSTPGLHSISLLVLNMYADLNVTNHDWKSVAYAFGPEFLAQNGGVDIAYSVVQEGVEPSGDAAAQLMFADMNAIAPAFDPVNGHSIIADDARNAPALLRDIAKEVVAYDEHLAETKAHLSDKDMSGLLVSSSGNFIAVSLDETSGALKDVSDLSGIDALKSQILGLPSVREFTVGPEGQAILDSAKYIAFAETSNLNATDVAHAFTNGYQIGDTSQASGIILGTVDQYHLTASVNGDVLIGGNQHDVLIGGNGNDLLIGGGGQNSLDGGNGSDVLIGGNDGNVLVGGNGIDQLYGGTGSDILITGTLDDAVGAGGGQNEVVSGGGGGDYIVLSDADTNEVTLDGGDSLDHLMLSPHMVDNSKGDDGSLPLFTLTGGVNTYIDYTYYSGPGPYQSFRAGGEIYIDSNGQENRQGYGELTYIVYHYGGASLSLFPYASIIWIAPNDQEPVQIDYKLNIKTNLLQIDVHNTTSDSDFYIDITNFHNGDYGINLQEFDLGSGGYKIDFDDQHQPPLLLNSQNDNATKAAQQEIDLANRYSLISEYAVYQNAMPASSPLGPQVATAMPVEILSADHLVMQITGTAQDDALVGTAQSERISGHGGNDNFDGNGGNDTIIGGSGNDTVVYHAGLLSLSVNLGGGNDTMLINDGALPTSFNLAASNIEQATWLQHDLANNQTWANITNTYDSAWHILSTSTLYDDNSHIDTTYDAANSQSWQTLRNDYNSAGQLIATYTLNDDNSRIEIFYDPANIYNWQTIQNDYNASGQLTATYYLLDNNTTITALKDPTDTDNWQTVQNDHVAAANPIWISNMPGYGNTLNTVYDVSNTQNPQGSSAVNDMSNLMAFQSHLLGTDVTSQTTYTAANHLASNTTTTHDNSLTQANYDVASLHGWNTMMDNYDASLHLINVVYA